MSLPTFDHDDLFATIQPDEKARMAHPAPEINPPTPVERLLAIVEKEYGPLPPPAPVTGATIRAACRFCRGRGCLACDAATDIEYKRQFPQGPQPLASFDRTKPEDMAALKELTWRILGEVSPTNERSTP